MNLVRSKLSIMDTKEYWGKQKTLYNWLISKKITKEQYNLARERLNTAYMGKSATIEDVKRIFNAETNQTR